MGNRKPLPDTKCETCGKLFQPKLRTARFCSSKCRPCNSREAANARARKAYHANPGKKNEQVKAWRERNPEYSKKYRRDHPEPFRLAARKWDAANPEKAAERAHKSKSSRRARVAGVFKEPFNRIDIFERDGWVCKICGLPVDKKVKSPHHNSPSIDHIVPISKGGSHAPSNVQCAHLGCNRKKHTSLLVDK